MILHADSRLGKPSVTAPDAGKIGPDVCRQFQLSTEVDHGEFQQHCQVRRTQVYPAQWNDRVTGELAGAVCNDPSSTAEPLEWNLPGDELRWFPKQIGRTTLATHGHTRRMFTNEKDAAAVGALRNLVGQLLLECGRGIEIDESQEMDFERIGTSKLREAFGGSQIQFTFPEVRQLNIALTRAISPP